jgi:CHRD domain
MRKVLLLASVGAVALMVVGASYAVQAGGKGNGFSARLTGPEETPMSISTNARGTFTARLDGNTIKYVLSYRGLEGGNTLFAHIHFGQRATSGGVSAFLCGGAPPASDKGPCPNGGGTVEGTIDPADVIGPAGQGIAAGEIHELIEAMRTGYAYANVHTETYQPGEIRGQIDGGKGKKGKRDDRGKRRGGGGDDD